MKRIFLVLLVFLAPLPFLSSRRQPKEKHFSLEAITAKHLSQPEWETRLLSAEEWGQVQVALSQPYCYLGSGGQCDAFVSQDDHYVIKFFKQKKFAIPEWMEHFPLPFLIGPLKNKKVAKREQKRAKVFSAFKLCFDAFQEETGLVYLHLNPTQGLFRTLSLQDAKGNKHAIPLDSVEFVLQKKAKLAYSVIDAHAAHGNLAEAKQAIDQLLKLHIAFYQKGLRNRDAKFKANCGFIDEKAVLIDVGRVVYSEEIKNPKNYTQELLQITPPFRKYLAKEHPELLPYFDQSLKELVSDAS